MPAQTPLKEALHLPVTAQTREEILDRLWPYPGTDAEQKTKPDWGAYFAYYHRQCSMALFDEGRQVCVRNHEDVLRITSLLTAGHTRSYVKSKISEGLTQPRTEEEVTRMLDGSVNLAARLLAMIDVGSLPSEISSRRALPWSDESLYAAIHTHFNSSQIQAFDKVSLGTDFTARNIVKFAGIDIVWVDNLLDHLRLVDGDRKLCVFHHVSFLKRMAQTQR